MPPKSAPPLVTGISPSLGPPACKLTIRGENLGNSPNDLIRVLVGGVDCSVTAQWHSKTRITVLVCAQQEGELDIVVETIAGGRGSSTVKFKLQYPDKITAYDTVGFWPSDERQEGPALFESLKSPTGIPESMKVNAFHGSQRPLSEAVLKSIYPKGVGLSADVNSERFDPKLYLLKYHKATKYVDLRDLLTRMETEMDHKTEEPISLMRDNLPALFEGLQNLLTLQEAMQPDLDALRRNELGERNSDTAALALLNALERSQEISKQIFNGVLQRKDRADATRTTLALLQRFKFLFQLPGSIRENIRRQQYNLVINDYLRAKALFSTTEVETFKKVYAEVESIIDGFKEELKARLLRMPSGFEESKETIRYLNQLGVIYDPAWECVKGQSEWFLDQFDRLKAADAGTTPSTPQDTPAATPLSPPMAQLGESGRFAAGKSGSGSSGGPPLAPRPVLYVEALCRLMRRHFPDFCRLGAATVAQSGPAERRALSKVMPRLPVYPKWAGRSKWQAAVNSVLQSFLEKITISTGDKRVEGEEVVPPSWLPHCAKTYRKCLQDLTVLKDSPSDALAETRSLCADLLHRMRVLTLLELLKKTEREVAQLGGREAWITEFAAEGLEGATTQLPILYENLVSEMLAMLQDIVVPQSSAEKELFDKEQLKEKVTTGCIRLMNAFPACLKEMALKTDSEKVYRHRSETVESVHSLGGSALTTTRPGKLIVLVNNCRWTRVRLNPLLLDAMSRLGFPRLERVAKETDAFYAATHDELLRDFMELKAGCVFGPIEMQMGSGEDSGWSGWTELTGVRHYMKTLLHACGAVHSEMLLVSPAAAQPCLDTVLVRVLEELRRCYHGLRAANDWDRHGRLQAHLDLRLLEHAFATALARHNEARSLFNCVMADVMEGVNPTPEEKKLLDNLSNLEMQRLRYLLKGLTV